uniref:NB-ARC domain-containing protein n=1 Tax=Rhizophora mucronata TaxID=61149 RepID=A0A2P2N2Q4_RHIMU
MGGIGKTTIAKALYGQIKSLFERHYFLADVRGEAEKHGLEILRERLLNGVSGEKIKTSSMPDIDQFFYMFRGTKVLVVLDNVDDRKQLKFLIGDLDCYGTGSIIIVTSRDRQLLKIYRPVLYEVEPLLPPTLFNYLVSMPLKIMVPRMI